MLELKMDTSKDGFMGLSYCALILITLQSPDGYKRLISDQPACKSRKNFGGNCEKYLL